jgi:hypothetical protein
MSIPTDPVSISIQKFYNLIPGNGPISPDLYANGFHNLLSPWATQEGNTFDQIPDGHDRWPLIPWLPRFLHSRALLTYYYEALTEIVKTKTQSDKKS